MATDKRRLRLGLAIGGGVVVAGALLTWFTVLPYVAENKINASLEDVSKRIGREVRISDLRLTGLRSAHIGRLSVSDVGKPEHVGVRLDGVDVALSAIPIGSDFRVQSIDIDDVEIALRMTGTQTNFDDILEKLKKSPGKKQEASGEKQSAKWQHYVTPLPDVRIQNASLNMPAVEIRPDLHLGAVIFNDFELRAADSEAFFAHSADSNVVFSWKKASPKTVGKTGVEIHGFVSALLLESNAPTAYKASVSGMILDGENGFVAVSQPKSEKGAIPLIFRENGAALTFENFTLKLPTTFEVSKVQLTANTDTLLSADAVSARLMVLPPKKVSGVYFKEIELKAPVVHDTLRSDGSSLVNWARATSKSWQNAEASKAKQNSSDKKKKKAKDYFFTQRFFISGGKLVCEDLRSNAFLNFAIDDINVEIGYRSIRKWLDYQIQMHWEDPVVSRIALDGAYLMRGEEQAKGRLTIASLQAGDSLKQYQMNLRSKFQAEEENALKNDNNAPKNESSSKLWEGMGTIPRVAAQWLLPSVRFDNAVLSFDVDYDYRVSDETLALKTSLSTAGIQLQFDALSKEPLDLNGKISANSTLDWKNKNFKFDTFQVSLGENALNFDFDVFQKNRKKRLKSGAVLDENAWAFTFHAQLANMPMQSLFEAIPHALRTELDGLQFQGNLGFSLGVNGFFDDISEVDHRFDLMLSEDFAVVAWPEMRNLTMLNAGFTHHVIDPNALLEHEIVIPPSVYPITIADVPVYEPMQTIDDLRTQYPHWVFFDDINPWLIQLITTTEDGSFFTHKGFSPLQVKAAIARNIARKSFSRGASTISMQLVKNLFFDRTKSVARKFQEVLYTWLMESVVQIPKKRIMELYFNIIEFGPEIYGIDEAAKYYFGKKSQALSLKECAFLMAIVPNPRKGATYRMQTVLPKAIAKTMNFYINEMYRRKCDPVMLSKMHARFEKLHQPVPFEPCCPPQDSLHLMLTSDTMSFYVPNPQDPLQYGYRPDLYAEDGTPLFPVPSQQCGYRGGSIEEMDPVESLDAIFGVLDPLSPVNLNPEMETP